MRERLRLSEGWFSLILLLLVVLTVAWSFQAGGLAEGLHVLPTVAAIGVLVGFLGAKSHLPGLLVHPLGLILGVVCCFLLVSTVVVLPPQAQALGGSLPSWTALLAGKAQFIVERLQIWVAAAYQGEINADPLPFVAQMAALTWLLAFYGAWFLFRSHWVWGAVLPSGLAVFLGVYYAPPRLLVYFILYLFWALILIVRGNVYQREREWQRHHIVYDQHIGFDFLRHGALLSLAVIGLVWLVPRPSDPGRLGDPWQRLQGPWQRVQEEWSRLYASLSYREQSGVTSFGRTVTLGGAISLSSTQVMEVQAPEAHYWRAVVLDRYTGLGWVDTSASTLQRAAGASLTGSSTYQARKPLVQTVALLRSGEPLLYAAADPEQVQMPTRLQVQVSSESGPSPPGGFEVSAIYGLGLGRGSRYVVRSLVSTASVRALREAGTAYPAWVTDRYLQWAATLPPRIRDLAQEVAGGAATPYDQAAAIEGYLRGLRYNQGIDAAPAGRDPVDWFLFDSQEGYCTYFASAMVLMCRALGLPARYAQGYAPGEYVAARQAFVVRELDAHAWPEVYFPGYGWIEFEPTPSQPPIARPSDEGDTAAGVVPGLPPGEREGGDRSDVPPPPEGERGEQGLPQGHSLFRRALWLELALFGLLVALAAGYGWRFARRWRALRPLERVYLRLTWASGLLGVSAHPYQTPLEFGRSLVAALGPTGEPARQIVQLYVRERFGGRAPTEPELAAAESAWQGLRRPIVGRAVRLRLAAWQARCRRARGHAFPELHDG